MMVVLAQQPLVQHSPLADDTNRSRMPRLMFDIPASALPTLSSKPNLDGTGGKL